MSLWIELHCDYHLDGDWRSSCHTYQNRNMMGMARNLSSTQIVIASIVAEAKRAGWRKINKKWACPHCRRLTEKNSS